MAIGLRVMHEGRTSEYHFDRARVELGRGPSNDLVIAAHGVAITHGSIQRRKSDDTLVFMTRAGGISNTMLVRDGDVVAELEAEAAGEFEMQHGDFVILGSSVRIEVLGEDATIEAPEQVFSQERIPQQLKVHPTAEFAQAYLATSEKLSAVPGDLAVLLEEVAALAGLGLGAHIREVVLSMWPEDDEFHAEVWSYQATQEGQIIGRARDPLMAFGAQEAQRMRDVLVQGEDYMRVHTQDACHDVWPLMRGDHAIGFVMISYTELSHTSVLHGIILRALGGLCASVVNAYQATRRQQSLNEENRYFRERERRHYLFKDLICESSAMRKVYRRLHELVQCHDDPVLVLGPAGSGKELLGRALHHLGERREGMFISIHCGHLSDEVLGVEFFGCVASELAGAVAARKGVFELARGGTVYIEEIDRLSMLLQGKLARMLKEGEVRRVGDSVGRQVDARIVVSTHRSVQELVQEGKFRHDLYMMLKEGALHVPSLMERAEDIMPLARNFLKVFARRHSKRVTGFDDQVAARLKSYTWPGNVRQLQTLVEAAVIKCDPEAPLMMLDDLTL